VFSLRAAAAAAWHIRFRTIQSIIITLASAKGSYYYISYCKERGAGNKGNNPCRPNCHNHPPLTVYYQRAATHTPLPAPPHTQMQEVPFICHANFISAANYQRSLTLRRRMQEFSNHKDRAHRARFSSVFQFRAAFALKCSLLDK
jgi:hypothetical protein